MAYLILAAALGGALLVTLSVLGPQRSAQLLRTLLAVAAAVTAFFGAFGLFTGRPAWAVLGLVALLLWLIGRWTGSRLARGRSLPGGSDVETDYLRMRLDHGSGTVEGEVLAGRFAGSRLEDLALADLLDLLDECAAADPPSAQLLEAYLDREWPDWRLGAREKGGAGEGGRRSKWARESMTHAEAWSLLGLAPGATADEIRAAHRRLMREHHPDRGGSTDFAARLNEAKELLLGE